MNLRVRLRVSHPLTSKPYCVEDRRLLALRGVDPPLAAELVTDTLGVEWGVDLMHPLLIQMHIIWECIWYVSIG